MTNQAGPEQYEIIDKYFATHAQDITEKIQVLDDTISIEFPHQNVRYFNDGWWGVYVLILYESPNIVSKICSEIYIADQTQIQTQNYNIEFPEHIINTP